jgi:hypothetical protein
LAGTSRRARRSPKSATPQADLDPTERRLDGGARNMSAMFPRRPLRRPRASLDLVGTRPSLAPFAAQLHAPVEPTGRGARGWLCRRTLAAGNAGGEKSWAGPPLSNTWLLQRWFQTVV